jgi:hypothetical protein
VSKPGRPPRLLLRWEALETWVRLAVSFPLLTGLLFLLNLGPLSQSPLRSLLYGLLEGAVFAGLLEVATATERSRRAGAAKEEPEDR